MKQKNIKSLIHNFAHSLQSFDFTHSSKVVFNVLTDVYCKTEQNEITFDFIKKEIYPEVMNTEHAKIILKDYKDWLPKLALSHNADLSLIEELKVKISVDFSKINHPPDMSGTVELEMKTLVNYKIKDRKAEQITISETDIYSESLLPDKLKKRQ